MTAVPSTVPGTARIFDAIRRDLSLGGRSDKVTAIRIAGVLCLMLLGPFGCGKDDTGNACPEPTQSVVGPDLGPDLSSVPACKLPDPEE
jgi:hypothetical protein